MAGEKENFKKRRSIAYVNAAERLHRAANDRGSMYIPGEDVYYGMQLPEVEVTSTRRGTGTSDTRHPVFETTSVPGWGITNSRNSWEQGRYSPVENVNPEFYTLAPALGVEDYLAGKAIGKGISSVANFVAPTIKNAVSKAADYLPTSSRRARYYGLKGQQDLVLALNSDAYKNRLMDDGFPFSETGYELRNIPYPGKELARQEMQSFINDQTKKVLNTNVYTFYNPFVKNSNKHVGRHAIKDYVERTFLGDKIRPAGIYLNRQRGVAKNQDLLRDAGIHESVHATSKNGKFTKAGFPLTRYEGNYQGNVPKYNFPEILDRINLISTKNGVYPHTKFEEYLADPDELRARIMTGQVKVHHGRSVIDDIGIKAISDAFGTDFVKDLAKSMYRKGGRRSLEN